MKTFDIFVIVGRVLSVIVVFLIPLLVMGCKKTMHRKTAILLLFGSLMLANFINISFWIVGIILNLDGVNAPYVNFVFFIWSPLLWFLLVRKYSKDPAWIAYHKPVYVRWLSGGGWNCPHCRMTNMDNRPCERCGAIPIFLSAQDSEQNRMNARQKRAASKYTPQFSDCFQEEEEQKY
ncbi:MAG TPA: hypothetical protein H9668_00505 [Firmicutes bacterium]|nr:hypothetical protein [Bacillota bacterium]